MKRFLLALGVFIFAVGGVAWGAGNLKLYSVDSLAEAFEVNEYAIKAESKEKGVSILGFIGGIQEGEYRERPEDLRSKSVKAPKIRLGAGENSTFDGYLFDDPIDPAILGLDKSVILICTDVQKWASGEGLQGKCQVAVYAEWLKDPGRIEVLYANDGLAKRLSKASKEFFGLEGYAVSNGASSVSGGKTEKLAPSIQAYTVVIKQSQFLGEMRTVKAVVQVDVSSCADDDRMPADELMQKLFPDFNFFECKYIDLATPIVQYTTSLYVGDPHLDFNKYLSKSICIFRNEHGLVFFYFSKDMRDKIAKERKGDTSGIGLSVNMVFINDTGQEAKLYPYAVFINGIPCAGMPRSGENFVVKPHEEVAITLSNVALESLLAHGSVPVFVERAANSVDAQK